MDQLDVFLETKIGISDYGYDQTLRGFEKSARKLGVEITSTFRERRALVVAHPPLPS
jgi:diketogulonate reductase-like aldo/keto reductase